MFRLFGVAFLTLVACLWTGSGRCDIRIVVAGPITGDSAVFGEQMVQGARRAVADINASGGIAGEPVALDVEDDACDPKQAVAVANRIAARGAALVVGHFCSASSLPASTVYAESGILEISPSTASAKYTEAGLWNTFRVCGRDDQQGLFTGHALATAYRERRIAILHDNSTFGKGIADATRAAMRNEGKNEDFYDGYTPTDTDYSALISRLKREQIDAVYIGGYFRSIGLIVRQARDQGYGAQFLGSTTLQTKALWQVGGEAIEGLRHVFYRDPRTLPEAAHAVQSLRDAEFEPDGFTLFTYAAVQVWGAAALHSGSAEPHKVAETLKSAGPWQSVLGPIAFNAKGDVTQPNYHWYVWHAGQFAPE